MYHPSASDRGRFGEGERRRQLYRRGGRNGNLKAIDACITRLRLTVGDSAKVNDAA
ncbi:hypothetical protein C9885_29950, partial [Klebsiella pneumoniae]